MDTDPAGPAPLLRLRGLTRLYRMGSEEVRALDGVDFDLHPGEYAAIIGASGSGKSTLMHVLGFMDRPTAGGLWFEGEDVARLGDAARAAFRSSRIGFVFQSFNLLPRLTVLDNVLLPLSYSRSRVRGARDRALALLARVGLPHRARHRPAQLSGGERQRVAIARALVNEPRLLLADEPTGNLDTTNRNRILDLFDELHASGQTIVLVTHDAGVAERCARQVRMQDGRILSDSGGGPRPAAAPAATP